MKKISRTEIGRIGKNKSEIPAATGAGRNPYSEILQDWTRHASGVIGAVTRKSSAARQALARDWQLRIALRFGKIIRDSISKRFLPEIPATNGTGRNLKSEILQGWTRHASGVIGAVTRKSSAARQALARDCQLNIAGG